MFSWDDFKDENKKIAVHCKTEEEAKNFCEMMDEHGMKWSGGDSYLLDTCWYVYAEDTCYVLGYYSSFEYYSKQGYTIYEFEEIGGKKMEFTKADLKDGMVVQYRKNALAYEEKELRRLVVGNSFIDEVGGKVNTSDEYDNDLRWQYTDVDNSLDIVKVFKIKKGFKGNLQDAFHNENLDLIWERKEPVELDTFEKEYLNRLLKGGFEYLARDKDGELYAYGKTPKKGIGCWDANCNSYIIDNCFDTFHFVKWNDDEPWSIEELLKNN